MFTARPWRWLRWGLLVFAGLGVLTVGRCVSALPDVTPLATHNPSDTSYMRLRPRADARPAPVVETWAPLAEIGPVLLCAVIKAEDTEFFNHSGFDGSQLFRALMFAAVGSPKMGGSTISQQLARNLFLDAERSVYRKASEAWLASRMEQRLGKRRILELYLNVIEWGDGVWGVAAASRHYFGKAPAELDAFEASLLAALIPAPTLALSGANLERAERVQRRILKQLHGSAVIDAAALQDASERASGLYPALGGGLPLSGALARVPSSLAPGAERSAEERTRRLEAALSTGCKMDVHR